MLLMLGLDFTHSHVHEASRVGSGSGIASATATTTTHRLHHLDAVDFVLELVLHGLNRLLNLFDFLVKCLFFGLFCFLVGLGGARGSPTHSCASQLRKHIIADASDFLLQAFNTLLVCINRRVNILELRIHLVLKFFAHGGGYGRRCLLDRFLRLGG